LKRLKRLETLELSAGALRLLSSARIAHLATASKNGTPHVIPLCFAFDGKTFYSSIDEKPKRSLPSQLKRLRNIEENPQVSLVIDRYNEDWSKLAYVLVFGRARILRSGKTHQQAVRLLRKKYFQYRTMALDNLPVIVIRPDRFVQWGDLGD